MNVTLKKPIKPGFRRPITLIPDEPVDALEGGAFASSEVVDGDSSAPTIRPESTAESIKAYVNGDGSLGTKTVRIGVDAHVGPEKVALDVDITYTVAHPDATTFSVQEDEADEPIPAPA